MEALLAADGEDAAAATAVGAAYLAALQCPVWCCRMANLQGRLGGRGGDKLGRIGEAVAMVGSGMTSGVQELSATLLREYPEDKEIQQRVRPALARACGAS